MKNLTFKLIIVLALSFGVISEPVQAQKEELRLEILNGHSGGGVLAVAVSPNGKFALTGSTDQTALLWDLETGKQLRRFFGYHEDAVSCVQFSKDGRFVLTASYDSSAQLWETATGRRVHGFGENRGGVLIKHSGKILSCAISADMKMVATAGEDRTARIWDFETGKQLFELRHVGRVYSIAFSPDSRLLLTGGEDKIARLYSAQTGKEERQFVGHSGEITSVAYSPDGKQVLTGSKDETMCLWNSETAIEIKKNNLQSSVLTAIYAPNGQSVIIGTEDCLVSMRNITSNEFIWGRFRLSPCNSMTVTVTPNGEKLLVPGGNEFDKDVYVFDVFKETQKYEANKKIVKVETDKQRTIRKLRENNTSGLWSPRQQGFDTELNGMSDIVNSIAISSDFRFVLTGGSNNTSGLWSVTSGQMAQWWNKNGIPFYSASVAFSPNNSTFAFQRNGKVEILDTATLKSLNLLQSKQGGIGALVFSPNGKLVLVNTENRFLEMINLETNETQYLIQQEQKINNIALSFDGKTIAMASDDKMVRLWNAETGEVKQIFKDFSAPVWSVAFSPDGKTIATASGGEIDMKEIGIGNAARANSVQLFDVETGKEIEHFGGEFKISSNKFAGFKSVAYSPDGKFIAAGSFDGKVYLRNNETKELKKFEGHTDTVNAVKFAKDVNDNLLVVSGSSDSTTRIWNPATGEEICALITFRDGNWAVVQTKTGRYDVPDGEIDGIQWVVSDNPLKPVPLSVFMRNYYEPNLLPRLLKCNREGNCDKEFKPVRNLTQINRAQPDVKISEIKPTDLADVVKVVVEVEDVASEHQKDETNKLLRSGVYDIRLFRDGTLVGYSTLDDKLQTTFKKYKDFDEELKAWQDANKVDLINGKKAFAFNVRLPKNTNAKEFNFTAYAFNSDRVKSETAQKTYTLPKPLSNDKGSAFIVTIGVNANEDRRYDLRYAANDARRLQEELARRLPKDKYDKIVQVSLISDYDADGRLAVNNATKSKIKAVLDKLAGKTVSDDALKDVPNKDLLKKVQPEDLVLIAFSGHGYADREGIFYLVPFDIGKDASGGLARVLGKSISSDELSVWLRDIDAGEMMMIVDACHSAAAVQGKDFKPGPMGSRGLGQLSYDKGMRILTATQADNVALEMRNLQHGLLTYSLIQNGIELGLADYQPKDDKLFSSEWLGFAVKDVPELYKKLLSGEIKGLLIDGAKPKSDVIVLDGQKSNLNLQQPTLFDFNRRARQYEFVSLETKSSISNK